MSKPRLEWKVGLFVFIGLVLLAIIVLQFSKGVTFFRPTYNILLRSDNVGGLKLHSMVLMAGVQVGTVSAIKLAPDGRSVVISLRIFSPYEVHRDARFSIKQSGFLGDQYVAIVPTKNEGPKFGNNEEALAEAPPDLLEVANRVQASLERFDETATNLSAAIVDVHRLVLNEQTLTNLAVAVNHLRSVSERAVTTVDEISALVSANAPTLTRSGKNLEAFSEKINNLANGLDAIVATNTPSLTAAVKNIESSSQALTNLLQDLQAGKGLGKLLKDETLALNMSQVANNLSVTSSNLNRLGLWGILWKKKPPATNAPASRKSISTQKSTSP